MTAPLTLPAGRSGAPAIDIARRCALEGGALALTRFGGDHDIGVKGRGNVVTSADLAVERLVHGILRDEFPGFAILSEETAADTDPEQGWVWVLDPIDGTKNYSVGIPFWCTTVALLHDAEPRLGITYDPVRGEDFWAIAGGGAWCGQDPITSSRAPDVNASVIAMDLGYDDLMGSSQIALMGRIFPNVQSMRILGSAALAFAYSACGRLDLFTHSNVSPWDVAAGMLLVREAGGVALDRDATPMRVTSTRFAAGGRSVVEDFFQRYVSVAET